MKKWFYICLALLSVSIQGTAQQYLNIYQDNVIIKQLSTAEVDSISVTETDPRIIRLWFGGEVILTYTSEEIDSITMTKRGGYPFAYIGIVGFNDQLYLKDIGILSSSTASQYKSFVNNLSLKNGTLLYYAVDNALDMLDNAHIETPLKNVSLITFTDGLDQGSLMMTDEYGSSYEYLDAMSNRIANTVVGDLSVNAYSVGLRGKDVSNVSLFKQNIQRLASSPDNAYEVSTINELRDKLKAIANQIISVSNRQTVSVKIPGIDSGTRVRFTFDGKSAETSQLYIEGTFNLKDRSLHEVTYHGIKATSGTTVQGTQNGIFVTYTFTGMRLESGSGLIPTSSIQHYYQLPSSSSWQINSEFNSNYNTQTSVSHSGAVIFLVLDCSSSLGSDFSKMKQYANEFIDLIAGNAEPFSMSAPKNVKAVLDDNEFVVHVSWDAPKYVQSYNVYRSNSSNGTYQLVAENITSTDWTDESPSEGYNYYKVSAVCYGSTSSQSSYASVNVKLEAPTNVTAAMDENEWAINVSWDAVKLAESYSVYRSSSSNYDFTLVADNIKGTSWRDETPLNGSNYYRIYATGHGFNSVASSSSGVVTCKISAPTNVSAALDDNEMVVHVNWEAVKYAQYYSVYRSSSSSSGFTKVADSLNVTSWNDDSPLNGSNYYRIYAMGHGLTSSASSTSNVVNCEITAPANVTASLDDNKTAVHVSWDAVKYAEYYSVYRSKSSSSGFTIVADSLKVTSWKDQSPLYGSNYYRIYAMGHGLTSSSSSTSNEVLRPVCPDNHHPHLIDLGLPSGSKWACCNVGATTPEGYGGYYAWGETETKSTYSESTYKYYSSSSGYQNLGSDIAATQYDVAHVKWGGSWQMPTYNQIKELKNNCTYTWTTENGVKGGKFTGPNGASIFLPAAGCRYDSGLLAGSGGYYWSSTQYPSSSYNAYGLDFYSRGAYADYYDRYYGQSVRPVVRK